MFSVRLACERATDEDLRELERFLATTANEPDDVNIERVLYYDQRFHETIARLAGNGEVLRTLKNINSRIYFVRWVAMTGQRATTQKEHREILRAVKARDPDRAAARMADHILHRKDQDPGGHPRGLLAHLHGGAAAPFPRHSGGRHGMNQFDGAAAVVTLLQKHGVKHIFGLCGDTSLPLYDALYRLDHGIAHILTRDERSAGYMADVYARLSSQVGVCEGPSGGGATYIAPALVEANESSSALIALTTDVAVASRGRFPLTELDQAALFRPLTKWNAVIASSIQIPHVLRRAFAVAAGGRPGSVHLGLPIDVQRAPVDEESVWGSEAGSNVPGAISGPDPAMVTRAARLLREASRPVIVAGGGPVISKATSELAAFAEKIGAPVLTSVSGRGVRSPIPTRWPAASSDRTAAPSKRGPSSATPISSSSSAAARVRSRPRSGSIRRRGAVASFTSTSIRTSSA